jgi:hypothetical protein
MITDHDDIYFIMIDCGGGGGVVVVMDVVRW